MPSKKTTRKTTTRKAKTRPRKTATLRKPAGRKASPRARLRRLVDELPEDKLLSVLDYAAYLRDRGDPFLSGVEEVDEPLSPEEIAGIEKGRRDCREGKGIPWEDLRKELVGA